MGTLLDTTVFIQVERSLTKQAAGITLATAISALLGDVAEDEEVGMASITASELLHGVHRASAEHRVRREAVVEALLQAFPPLAFDLICARAHARIWAEMAAAGADVGPHDRIVAATALARGWRVATANRKHYDRIPSLELVELKRPA